MAKLIYVIKLFLVTFFILHTIFGMIVICGGTIFLFAIPAISRFGLMTSALKALAIYFVIFGIITILTVWFGCYAIFRESFRCLLVISLILTICWIFDSCSLIQYILGSHNILSDENKAIVKDKLMKNKHVSKNLILIQALFQCCGFDSAKDWKKYGYKTVPESCCYKQRLKDENNSQCMDYYWNKPFMYPLGCYEKFNLIYKKRSRIITIALIVVLVIETIGVAFAFSLASLIRKRDFLGTSISNVIELNNEPMAA